MKLFSLGRTDLAVSSKLPTPVGLVKVQKDNNSAAHVRNGMVYLTVPLDRRFRAQRPELQR